jgi:hypothetical protein
VRFVGMKHVLIFFTICIGLLFWKCSPSIFKNYHGECIGLEYDGYVKIIMTNSNKKYSLNQAEKEAVHLLLYSGFVGGKNCQTQPPILRNEEQIKKFKVIESDFFSDNGNWRRFVKSNSFKNTSQNIVFVSRDQLINYLQEKLIIKSLNSGF